MLWADLNARCASSTSMSNISMHLYCFSQLISVLSPQLPTKMWIAKRKTINYSEYNFIEQKKTQKKLRKNWISFLTSSLAFHFRSEMSFFRASMVRSFHPGEREAVVRLTVEHFSFEMNLIESKSVVVIRNTFLFVQQVLLSAVCDVPACQPATQPYALPKYTESEQTERWWQGQVRGEREREIARGKSVFSEEKWIRDCKCRCICARTKQARFAPLVFSSRSLVQRDRKIV